MTNRQTGDRCFHHQDDHLIGGDYQLLEEDTQRFGSWKAGLYRKIDNFAQSVLSQSLSPSALACQSRDVCLPQAMPPLPESRALLLFHFHHAVPHTQPDTLLATNNRWSPNFPTDRFNYSQGRQ